MKLLTPEEMTAADQATFSKIGLPARAVMEVAGRQVVSLILNEYAGRLRGGVLVVCGGGNNGGDGYVAARTLHLLGVPVQVCSLKPVTELSGDCRANVQSFLKCGGTVVELQEDDWQSRMAELQSYEVVVDAIFGTGFKGEVREFAAGVIASLNTEGRRRGVPIVAVDIPSGVEACSGRVHGEAVQASVTICLQAPKIGHVQFPGSGRCGRIYCADIGVSLDEAPVERTLVTEDYAAAALRQFLPVGAEAHKGTRGHVAVIGGSAGHFGAPKLSAEAALRSGAGLVTMYIPSSAAAAAAPQCRELMCAGLADEGAGRFSEGSGALAVQQIADKEAVVIGPGLGTSAGAKVLLDAVLQRCSAQRIPLVIDADALNLLSVNEGLYAFIGPNAVLTPHPGEMARLMGVPTEEVQSDRLGAAQQFAKERGCWLVLKGARSVSAGPQGQVHVNPAASPVLATAGCGDALAGVLAAFAAWGMPVEHALRCGVFIHGAAGELAERHAGGIVGTTAGDIIARIPAIINTFYSLPPHPVMELRQILPGSLHGSAAALA